MRRRGITLVELMLALTISALVILVAGSAYTFGARTSKRLGDGRDAYARRAAFESALGDLFAHAYVDSDATNLATYFVSGDAISAASPTGNGSTSSSSSSSNSAGDESSIAFTVIGRRLPSTLLSSTDDFETNNGKFGPVGGVTEIQLGTTPVGEAPVTGGLFLRQQTPSDADDTQGGDESQFSPDIDTIRFKFYDGTDWVTTWNTTTMGTRRLPSAVRVTYKFLDETDERTLIFPIPSSDVTQDNPLQQETTS